MFLHRNEWGTAKYFGKVVTRHDIYSVIKLGRILKLNGDVAQFIISRFYAKKIIVLRPQLIYQCELMLFDNNLTVFVE